MYSFWSLRKNVVLALPNLSLHWAFVCFEKNEKEEVLSCCNAKCKTRVQIAVARDLPSSIWACHVP